MDSHPPSCKGTCPAVHPTRARQHLGLARTVPRPHVLVIGMRVVRIDGELRHKRVTKSVQCPRSVPEASPTRHRRVTEASPKRPLSVPEASPTRPRRVPQVSPKRPPSVPRVSPTRPRSVPQVSPKRPQRGKCWTSPVPCLFRKQKSDKVGSNLIKTKESKSHTLLE